MTARTALLVAVAVFLGGCKATYRGVDWHFWLTTEFEFEEMHRAR
jgi:hypothetical protein